jgi:hypothetical protein
MQNLDDIRHQARMASSRGTWAGRPDISEDEVRWFADTVDELCDELDRRPASPAHQEGSP